MRNEVRSRRAVVAGLGSAAMSVWGGALQGSGGATGRGEPAGGISVAEFERLYRALRPPRGEAWRALPWETSLLAARDRATREKKPIYMLVRSGHPLGCV